MLCPNCKKPGLDLSRAKHNAELYGSKTFLVSAPCCGAPLSVRVQRVVLADADIWRDVQRKEDDWGAPIAKDWRQRRMCEHCGESIGHKPECITQNPPAML